MERQQKAVALLIHQLSYFAPFDSNMRSVNAAQEFVIQCKRTTKVPMHDTSWDSAQVSITNFHQRRKPLWKSQAEIIYYHWPLINYPHCETNLESWHSWTSERENGVWVITCRMGLGDVLLIATSGDKSSDIIQIVRLMSHGAVCGVLGRGQVTHRRGVKCY